MTFMACVASARRRPVVPVVPHQINLSGLTADSTSINGFVLEGGFTSDDTLKISKQAGMLYQAWSRFDNDTGHDGSSWINEFYVTTREGVQSIYWTGFYATAADAESAVIGSPIYLTGSSKYTIWLNDDLSGDNRGGLSVMVSKL